MPERKFSPRQIVVLKAVRDGKVWEHYPIGNDPIYSDMDRGPDSPRPRYSKVTDAIQVLYSYSLVRLSNQRAHFKDARKWEITDDGIRLLEEEAKWVPRKRGRPRKTAVASKT